MDKFHHVIVKILDSIFGIVLCLVSAFVFYVPYEIEIIPKWHNIFEIARPICLILLVIFFFLLYISGKDFFKNNIALFIGLAFLGYLIYRTWQTGGDMTEAMTTEGFYGIPLMLVFAIFIKTNPRKYLVLLFFLYAAVCAANIYTVFKYDGIGMWEVYEEYRNTVFSLVGNYNVGIRYFMPMVFCGAAYSYLYSWWLQPINYIMIIANIVMAFKANSDTQIYVFIASMAVIIVTDIIKAAPKSYKFFRIFNGVTLAVLNLLIFAFVVPFNRLWLGTIGPATDFHNRLYIWDGTMEMIKANPITGYGLEEVVTFASKFPGHNPAHCHCFYLELPYCTGLIGVVLFLALVVITLIAVMKAKKPGIRFLMGGLLFCVFLASIFESYLFSYCVMMLVMAYYISKFGVGERKRGRKAVREEEQG
ncbi:MAG: O-antigen ligase family protein [Parasporobacterium sp.]|nr:O-antigen ligase family protein [Parasporobacterium sp.]